MNLNEQANQIKHKITKNRIAVYKFDAIESGIAKNSKVYLLMYEIPLSFDHRASLVWMFGSMTSLSLTI